MAGGADITNVVFSVVMTRTYAMVTLIFGRPNQAENKCMFDELEKHKNEIENSFGDSLIWERKDDGKRSSLSKDKSGFNYFNEEEWPEIIMF